jgi:nucleoside 2-deoxyribosyltransferase
MRIYLAGPDVYLHDAAEIGQKKRELCLRFGFEALFPLDNERPRRLNTPLPRAIFKGNIAMIRKAHVVVANLTPFRGVSADAGTAFELGYAFALDKCIVAYSNVPDNLQKRVPRISDEWMRPSDNIGTGRWLADGNARRRGRGRKLTAGPDGRLYGPDGFAVENFGYADNLMIVEALLSKARQNVIVPPRPVADISRDLDAFETCLRLISKRYGVAVPPRRQPRSSR